MSVQYVCMSAGKVKCQFFSVFFCFFPNRGNLSTISMVAQEKKQKNVSFYVVCMYVRPKLTFVSFFSVFFCPPSPKEFEIVLAFIFVNFCANLCGNLCITYYFRKILRKILLDFLQCIYFHKYMRKNLQKPLQKFQRLQKFPQEFVIFFAAHKNP